MTRIEVHGAGPAGSAAAITARLCGAGADLYDPSPFPRHKVCGEFLSPEVLSILDALGVGEQFLALQPVRYTDLTLRFGHRTVRAALPKPSFGLSRHALDHMLLRHAESLGARLHRQRAPQPADTGQGTRPIVHATGRHGATRPAAPGASRYFGFKAHRNGEPHDPLTLYFHRHTYIGINLVEGGVTNVCGIAPESDLARFDFRIDDFLAALPGFSVIVEPLRPAMRWMTTAPVIYSQNLSPSHYPQYFAGDTLSFIDPFTGSGQLSALLTGSLAGYCASRGIPADAYRRMCRRVLTRPFWSAAVIRAVLQTPLAALAAQCLPLAWLVRATRPVMSGNLLDVLGFLKKENRRILGGRYPPVGSLTWAR